MAPLSEKALVERIRYNALLGLLECAEEVIDEPLDVELNHAIVDTNFYVLTRLQELFPYNMNLNEDPPSFNPFPCECDCPCDEAAPEDYADVSNDFPWIYFYSKN